VHHQGKRQSQNTGLHPVARRELRAHCLLPRRPAAQEPGEIRPGGQGGSPGKPDPRIAVWKTTRIDPL
ncbi:MAG: hypothetical protein AVDCRST_MAG56-8045, partial [uncultured Cytophagales bacterium]